MAIIENRRILIVDDNQALHEDFKKILLPTANTAKDKIKDLQREMFGNQGNQTKTSAFTDLKYELDFATQGEEALNKVVAAFEQGNPFALVFMDVRMPPGWDGITTIAKIWEKVPLTEVVICTAYSDYSLDDVISKLGLSERLLFLKKPFDSVEVMQIAIAQTKKWNLERANIKHTESLEGLVDARTKELELERARGINSAKLVALGEMAGGIAHEINNPLAIILSNINMQKDLLSEETLDKEMIVKIADKIESTTTRIAKIIKGLRAFSRSGDKDPFESTSLRQIILEALGICGEKFKVNNVKLTFDENVIPMTLMIDCRSTQIIQVLLNLLNNGYDAIQSIPEKWVKIEIQDKNDRVLLSLTDCGSGIPKKVQDKLFQPFFTTKEIGQGTGLGLSISKGIIEDHKGTLKIDNECPNTRFVIELPKKNLASTLVKAV